MCSLPYVVAYICNLSTLEVEESPTYMQDLGRDLSPTSTPRQGLLNSPLIVQRMTFLPTSQILESQILTTMHGRAASY